MAKQNYLMNDLNLNPQAGALPTSPWSMLDELAKAPVEKPGVQTKKSQQGMDSSTRAMKRDIYSAPDVFSQRVQDIEQLPIFQEQKSGISELENMLAMAQEQKDTPDYDWFVRPLLNLTDAQTGSRMLAGYQPATSSKKDTIAKLTEALGKQRGEYAKQITDTLSKTKEGTESTSQTQQLMNQLALMTGMAMGRGGAAGKPSVGEDAVDKLFAKEYVQFVPGGGFAEVQSNLKELDTLAQELKSKKDTISGPYAGALPPLIRQYNPYGGAESVDIQQRVESMVQANMRQILGSQFTDNEGKRVTERAYNPRLDEVTNAKRLEKVIREMSEAAQAKLAASKYFEANGTIKGYPGTLRVKIGEQEYSVDPTQPASSSGTAAPKTTAPKTSQKSLDEMTNEELEAYIKANGG